MKNDKRLDEAFRKGLPAVDVPPPPSQDWAAMARSAKQGARAAAVRDRSAALSARWMRLLGGATAILAAWYLVTADGSDERATVAPSAATAPARQADLLGGTAATIAELLDDKTTPADDGSADRSSGIPASARRPAERAALFPATAEKGAEPASGEPARSLVNKRSTADAPAGRSDRPVRIPGYSSIDPISAGMPTTTPAGSPIPSADPVQDGKLYVPADGSMDPVDPVHPMSLLSVQRAALAYLPNDRPEETVTDPPSFARWSVSPWFAFGHSTWNDPEQDGSSIEQLKVGQEQPGSIGLRIQYAFDHRLALITGIQYARKGSLRGTLRSSAMLTTDYALSGDYLEVPLSVKLSWPMENKGLYLRIGGLLQFNRHNGTDRVAMHDASRKELSTLMLARGSMGTALDLGVGAQFRLSRRWGLFIEPSYQYALSSVVKHPSFDQLPFNPRIHTFSLATGLSFQLD